MKKILLTLVALMSMTTTFAENEGMNTTEAYNMTVNMKSLAHALGLTNDQVESVAEVHKTFSTEMMFAAQYGKDERSKMVEKAVNKDLSYLRWLFGDGDKWQYVKSTSSAVWNIVPFAGYVDLGEANVTNAPEITFTMEEIDGTKTAIKAIDAENAKQE